MGTMLRSIGQSKNGIDVVYDPKHSHAATHLEDTPQLKGLVQEVVSSLVLTGQKISADFDMGRVVGTCDVVEVDESDEIVYGTRKNRKDDGLVPFTKSREGDPCSYVAVQLTPEGSRYILDSAWIGRWEPDEDQPFPQSPNATKHSISYWTKHAFVYGSQEIIPGTETCDYPW